MRDFVILTDSAGDLPAWLAEELDVCVLPLQFNMGGKTYHDSPDHREMSLDEFYTRLQGGEMPTTNAVNIGQATEAIEPLLKEGKDVLVLAFSSGLSTTYQSFCLAAEELNEKYPEGKVLVVSGADMMDGTPIYDIKPYIAYADSHADAKGGFVDAVERHVLSVECPEELLRLVPEEKRAALLGVLAQDPRPSYQEDPERVYGMAFAGLDVKFTVDGSILAVRGIEKSRA